MVKEGGCPFSKSSKNVVTIRDGNFDPNLWSSMLEIDSREKKQNITNSHTKQERFYYGSA